MKILIFIILISKKKAKHIFFLGVNETRGLSLPYLYFSCLGVWLGVTEKKRWKETKYQKYLTDDEWKLISNWLETKLKSPPTRLAIYTMTMLGLRVGEVVPIKREQFTSDFSTFRYMPLKKRSPKIHEVAVPEALREKLVLFNRKYNHRFRDGHMFFPFMNGSKNKHIKISSIHWVFKKMRNDLNLNDIYYTRSDGNKFYRISPHTCRHYFAYKFYKASNNDIVATKERLCHEKMNTTAIYIQSLLSAGGRDREIINMAFNIE